MSSVANIRPNCALIVFQASSIPHSPPTLMQSEQPAQCQRCGVGELLGEFHGFGFQVRRGDHAVDDAKLQAARSVDGAPAGTVPGSRRVQPAQQALAAAKSGDQAED
jgi:hypothetical protein